MNLRSAFEEAQREQQLAEEQQAQSAESQASSAPAPSLPRLGGATRFTGDTVAPAASVPAAATSAAEATASSADATARLEARETTAPAPDAPEPVSPNATTRLEEPVAASVTDQTARLEAPQDEVPAAVSTWASGSDTEPIPAPIPEPTPAPVPVPEPLPEPDPVALAAFASANAPSDENVTAEQARLERERAARREARMAALAPVSEDDPLKPASPPPAPQKPQKKTTDKFAGSLALFLLRVVTAGILFIHGLNGIINSKPVVDTWANTILPYPRYIALGISVAEVAVAIMLLFGILTRVAGLILFAIMAGTLAFVMWGPWSIFEVGGTGFIGEHELLLATVGLAFLFLGAGAWSVDYMVRRNRAREGIDF